MAAKRTRRRRGRPATATPLLVGLSLAAVAVLILLQVVDRPTVAARTPPGPRPEPAVATESLPPSVVASEEPGAGPLSATPAASRPRASPVPLAPPPVSDLRQPEADPGLPRVAIVLDDCGQRLDLMERAVRIRTPLTFAVIPRLPYSRPSAELAFQAGHEVIVHQPMEPEGYPETDPGAGAILRGMRPLEIGRILDANLAEVPHASGLNNHMGSRATADPELMAAVMASVVGRQGPEGPLYFFDSRTTAETVAWEAARRRGIATAQRAVFLDNEADPVAIRAQIDLLLERASEEGEAIGIGHLKPETLQVLETVLPRTPARGYRFVLASQLMH